MTEFERPAADVALAEFNALRAEIVAHLTARGTLMTLAITAIGIVGGFVLDKGGSNRLLLILPFLVCAIGIKSSEHTRRIFLLTTYIREQLWPYLTPCDPGPAAERGFDQRVFPNWGRTLAGHESVQQGWRSSNYITHLLLHGLPGAVVFGLGSFVPLALLPLVNGGLTAVWYDWILWTLALLLMLLYGWLAFQSERATAQSPADVPPQPCPRGTARRSE
jgi:hypothetical protein